MNNKNLNIKNKNVLICGKISNLYSAPSLFASAEYFLRTKNPKTVFNPCAAIQKDTVWEDCMKVTLGLLERKEIDVAYFLPNWESSKGSILERDAAIKNGVKIIDHNENYFRL
jgi:hypothetical protein